jgi:hypothetical protein
MRTKQLEVEILTQHYARLQSDGAFYYMSAIALGSFQPTIVMLPQRVLQDTHLAKFWVQCSDSYFSTTF